jgi:hypothetical protein
MAINLNYVRRFPSRNALAARASDDLHDLLGFYAHDLIVAEEEGRTKTAADLRKVVAAIECVIPALESEI